MMETFQIGDRVECVAKYDHIERGMVGFVFYNHEGSIGVQWDNFEGRGHSASSANHNDRSHSSYFVNYETITVITSLENE